MNSSIASCLLSPYLLYEIGNFLSFADRVTLTRVNKIWYGALKRVGRKRKSLSLTPFLNGCHVQDSLVAYFFKITREDLIGNFFYTLYKEESRGGEFYYSELENKIESFFRSLSNSCPNIEYLQVMWLTEFMLQKIASSFPRLKGLAFHEAFNSASFNNSGVKEMSSNLKIIAFGLGTTSEFVAQTLPHVPVIKQLVFMSAKECSSGVNFQCLREVGEEIREIFFGSRPLEGLEEPDAFALPAMIAGSNLKNITLLEILSPKVNSLDFFIRKVLPCFTNLNHLSISLPDTSSLSSGASDPASLCPRLTHLTVIVDSPLYFEKIFGHRKDLESLTVSAVPQEPEDDRSHIVDFDLTEIESIISQTPNLEFLCISSYTIPLKEKENMLLKYAALLCRKLKKLRTIHMPHTESLADKEIITIPETGLPYLRRIEFIGTVNEEVKEVQKWMRDKGLQSLKVRYQDYKYYCMCPYLKYRRV